MVYEQFDHFGFFAAHERASEGFIGWFHLRPDRYEPEAMEPGYRLLRHTWGHGYATEGGRALVEKAFAEWGVERVVARALVGNRASQRVMQKCGLGFAETFIYPEGLLPDWTEEERRAVKYEVSLEAFLTGRMGGV